MSLLVRVPSTIGRSICKDNTILFFFCSANIQAEYLHFSQDEVVQILGTAICLSITQQQRNILVNIGLQRNILLNQE